MKKIALVTGVTGQDGSYLTELLLEKGYKVHGLLRRSTVPIEKRIKFDIKLLSEIELHFGDITDPLSLNSIIREVRPTEIYNLAANTFVPGSWEAPKYTMETVALPIMYIADAVRAAKLDTKIYQASTSEMFSGDKGEAPQNEKTPMRPNNPYGIAKLYAHNMAIHYRDAFGMFICCGILFNHESERRGENFVTRKITLGLARIYNKQDHKIHLGNLYSARDWGYAKEYVDCMWRMMQRPKPDDYIIGTGEMHSVAEFCEYAFNLIGVDWKDFIVQDPRFLRPKDVQYLRADASKAKRILKWKPEVKFKELVEKMVFNDLELLKTNNELNL